MSYLIHYLDDFLTMGAANSEECENNLKILVSLCQELGLPLKWQKLEGPAVELVFLGILLDTRRMELRLPPEKLSELKVLIVKWLGRKKGKKRELLSLIGKLSHAAKIIKPGRIFLRRMLNCTHKAKRLDHWVHLSEDFKSDLAWWACFIENWNGIGMMASVARGWKPAIEFYSDASGSWGCGATWQDRWIQAKWDGQWPGVHITSKELLPVILAVAIWGPWWRGEQVLVHCDNMAVVNIISANTSKDSLVMHLLRGLHFVCAYYNISLQACHIPGTENSTADAISRNLLQVFFERIPRARATPSPIPSQLWDILVKSQPDWRSENWRRSLANSLRIAWQIAQGDPMPPVNPSTLNSVEGMG